MKVIDLDMKRRTKYSQCNLCASKGAVRKCERDMLIPSNNRCYLLSMWSYEFPRVEIYMPDNDASHQTRITCDNFELVKEPRKRK